MAPEVPITGSRTISDSRKRKGSDESIEGTRTSSAESGFKVPAPKSKSRTAMRSAEGETGTRSNSAESGFQDSGFKAPAPKTDSVISSNAGGTRTNSAESAFVEPGFKMPSAPPVMKKSKKHRHLESTSAPQQTAPQQTATSAVTQQTTSLNAQDISMIPHSQTSMPNLLPSITIPQVNTLY